MADTDGRAELRGRIDELKLELIRFVLFEVSEGEAAHTTDRLAEPVRKAIEAAVKEAVVNDFAEGSKKIAETAEALDRASQEVVGKVEALQAKLAELDSAIGAAREEANALKRDLAPAAKQAQSESIAGGPRSVPERMSIYKDGPTREPGVPDATKASDPQTPTSTSSVTGAEPAKEPDPASTPIGPWLKKHWWKVLIGIAFAATLVALVVVVLNQTQIGTADEAPQAAPQPVIATSEEIRNAATALTVALVADDLAGASASEPWRRVGATLQAADAAVAEVQSGMQRRPQPLPAAEEQYHGTLGRLRQSIARRQAAVADMPQAEEEIRRAEIGRLRELATALTAAADQMPVSR